VADRLLISAPEALTVMLSTTGIYLSFVVLLRVVGQRLVSGLGAFDLAAAMAMGALVGRVILGHTPVLAAGVVGLVTLAALQTLVGRFRDTPLGSRLITPAPVLLMADGELLTDNLRRTGIVEAEINGQLRRHGIRGHAEVAAVVLEPAGTVSVLRRGEPLDRAMLEGVRGADRLPDSLFR